MFDAEPVEADSPLIDTTRAMMKLPFFSLALCFLAACSSIGSGEGLGPGIEARALTGVELRRPTFSVQATENMQRDLALARREHALHPDSEDAAIWHGRRLAYLGQYRDALEVYDDALQKHPQSYRLLRHRGHRYITLRRLGDAVADLQRASTLAHAVPDRYELDGAPNPAGIPRSTTRSNIEYHLGLALYLEGRFAESLEAWERCLFFSNVNDDALVAALYWNVLTLWRLGRELETKQLLDPIHAEMEILENHDYHRLLLFYKGVLTEGDIITELWRDGIESATLGYGLGAWNMVHGKNKEAQALFAEIVEDTPWAAFGHIAAEAEIARN